MKIKLLLIVVLLIAALAASAQAQDAKVTGEIVRSSEKVVKNSPFSAEAVTESVQILADGNRITHKATTKVYRDGEGRFRRDEMLNPGGVLGTTIKVPETMFILDPVAGLKFYLDLK